MTRADGPWYAAARLRPRRGQRRPARRGPREPGALVRLLSWRVRRAVTDDAATLTERDSHGTGPGTGSRAGGVPGGIGILLAICPSGARVLGHLVPCPHLVTARFSGVIA
jgi:hypothetical protein